jgi:hypothetical protein
MVFWAWFPPTGRAGRRRGSAVGARLSPQDGGPAQAGCEGQTGEHPVVDRLVGPHRTGWCRVVAARRADHARSTTLRSTCSSWELLPAARSCPAASSQAARPARPPPAPASFGAARSSHTGQLSRLTRWLPTDLAVGLLGLLELAVERAGPTIPAATQPAFQNPTASNHGGAIQAGVPAALANLTWVVGAALFQG